MSIHTVRCKLARIMLLRVLDSNHHMMQIDLVGLWIVFDQSDGGEAASGMGGGAGVQEPDAIALFEEGDVGVAEHHEAGLEVGELMHEALDDGFVVVAVARAVGHDNRAELDGCDEGFLIDGREIPVHIAAHEMERGEGFKLEDEAARSYVAAMEDALGALEDLVDLRGD